MNVSIHRYSLQDPSYLPSNFLDRMRELLDLRSDADLGMVLELNASHISRIRRRAFRLPAYVLLILHDLTGIDVDELRRMAGLPILARPPSTRLLVLHLHNLTSEQVAILCSMAVKDNATG